MLHDNGHGVVVVGASVAGVHAAEALRDNAYSGPITVLDAEPGPASYDRPPLSKQLLLGEWDLPRAALRAPAALADRHIDTRYGVHAVGLDVDAATVHTSHGPQPFDGLIIATGATPRRLPGVAPMAGLHGLRTASECLALRADFERGAELVIVGAGFIGMEVAAAARAMGVSVTVVDTLDAPMAGQLGRELGQQLQRLHEGHGVRFLLGRGVTSVRGVDRVESVELDDGTVLRADVVLVGIGARPVTDWLSRSGLDTSDGLICDRRLFAAPQIVGAGDVVNWHNPRYDRRMRIEHWTTAMEHGAVAAGNLLGDADEHRDADLVPYFWSDQYGVRIQQAGITGATTRVVRGDPDTVVVLSGDADLLTGVIAVGADRAFVRARRLLRKPCTLDDAEDAVASLLARGGVGSEPSRR
ncbi:NAD(P)/FAD-dependent oxidoreductase [Pseudonocardia endophytica]|uniref:NADPH-dependent 2,4-dienoyl-CoA reductase/sulfur reductase-like enzyme n=1 Tax=Pseudonocardia endophytica TaxID=401976 RepID=A0A4R1I110_PSEEN|nr:FAD-dependent oxidoreductase [Pseudonocardia endophytica]TCK27601.1 NADPH-dependent 2,4-dienoyl-CoA reductase/sulfur reductase-like enzyme [Pseudonocardia endophytica]